MLKAVSLPESQIPHFDDWVKTQKRPRTQNLSDQITAAESEVNDNRTRMESVGRQLDAARTPDGVPSFDEWSKSIQAPTKPQGDIVSALQKLTGQVNRATQKINPQPSPSLLPQRQGVPSLTNVLDEARANPAPPQVSFKQRLSNAQPDLLSRMRQQYPWTRNADINVIDSTAKGDSSRKLEFYPADETDNPRPGKPSIEIFDKGMKESDLMGEILSHHLPSIDPKVAAFRQRILSSMTPQQKRGIRGDYESERKSALTSDSFETWLSKQGGDSFFRGYPTGQWDAKEYTPQQKKIYGELQSYLDSKQSESTQSLVPKVGGVPNLTNILNEARANPDPRAQRNINIRDQVIEERQPTTMSGKIARNVTRVTDNLNPFEAGYNLLRPEEDIVGEETNKRIEAANRASDPEMIAERQARGQMSAPRRVVDDVITRAGADSAKLLGGVSSLAGIAPNRLSEYLNRRGQVWEEGTLNTPLDTQGNEVNRGFWEKLGSAAGDLGLGVGEIVAMKKASGLSLAKIMAIETALKTSDQPIRERAAQVAQATAMGRILDGHLSKGASAALFGAPTAVQSGTAYLQGKESGTDALLNTVVQAGAGAILGGSKTVPESPRTLDIQVEALKNGTRDAVLITKGEQRPDLPPRMSALKTREGVFYFDPQKVSSKTIQAKVRDGSFGEILGNVSPKPETGEPTTVVTAKQDGTEAQTSAVPPERANEQAEVLQAQYPDAKIETGPPEKAVEILAKRTEDNSGAQSVDRGPLEGTERTVAGTDEVGDTAAVPVHHSELQNRRARNTEHGNKGQFKAGKVEPTPEPSPVGILPSSSPENSVAADSQAAAPPLESPKVSQEQTVLPGEESTAPLNRVPAAPADTTAAKRESMSADRAELDLPELPKAERKGWQTSLDNAKDKGLDKKASLLADEVLNKPRSLNDEETAGLVLRTQELKNDHARVMQEIGDAKDSATIQGKVAERDAIENEIDRLTRATKASGTEKGRSLASQKLTINQDYDLVSLIQRAKAAKGRDLTPEERTRYEGMAEQIKALTADLAESQEKVKSAQLQKQIDRVVRRGKRAETRQALDDEFADLRAAFAKAKIETRSGVQASGLAGLDPEGVLTKLVAKMARNRVRAGVVEAENVVDQVYEAIKEHVEGITKRDVRDAISGYGLEPKGDQRSPEAKQLADIRSQLKQLSKQEDIESGKTLSPRDKTRQSQLLKQEQELQRRLNEGDFSPKAQREPVGYSRATQDVEARIARVKLDYERGLRKFESDRRPPAEKAADLLVKWSRAAKLSYISTLGKLGSAATGRMVTSPVENLVGEIPHRLLPELSRKATTEGGGFNTPAEVAALWKSGRFKQVLNQITKGSSDLDVLYGSKSKMLDKEMSGEGVLGIPGRVHGALKEYPRQAEFDRAFIKTLKSYDQQGKDISDPGTQLAARMEAFNSAERARFQQRNFISDTFNDAMSSLERKGLAGKVASKTGRFLFPITRVPVNVVGETLNYTLGIPRAAIETAIRGGVKNLTPEQANNIMRAYKKGGVGLAVMTYAFLHPQQFGGYYQRNDNRSGSEPKAGEVMFFGHRIPKWATHIPLVEAGQLAGTVRRVYDKFSEKGSSKTDALTSGAVAAGKGLAEQIPFYETPRRFAEGAEGGRETATRWAGQQVKGMIPGFIQEAARFTDKNAAGETTVRKRSGFVDEIKEGVPYLRKTLPENVKASRTSFKNALKERMRDGQSADLEGAVAKGQITESDKRSIERDAKLSSRQETFEKTRPAQALDRFERMNANQREEVRELMVKKAYTLVHSTALTQDEKDAFRERVQALGLDPDYRPSRKGNDFKSTFERKSKNQFASQF